MEKSPLSRPLKLEHATYEASIEKIVYCLGYIQAPLSPKLPFPSSNYSSMQVPIVAEKKSRPRFFKTEIFSLHRVEFLP